MAETLSAKTSQALGITDPIKDLTTKRDTAVQEELGAGAAVQALETRKAEAEARRTSELEGAKVKATEELTQRQAEREAPIKEQKSAIDKALMNEHFAPSKENLQDQAALFSLINVIGFAIGTGGKQNAMLAMHAMNGMLEGHQKGRADLFKEEQVKFDKNFKALQQKATFLETELRHSLEEFTRDKRAADERASAAFASAGADFMKIYAEKNGLVAAYERAKEVRKSLDKAIEGERLRKEKIEDKAAADAQREKDREFQIRLAASLRRPAGESTRATAADKYGYGVGPSGLVEEFIGERLPTKQAEPIVQSAAAIGEANQLKDIVRADPGIVGREGQVRQFVNKYIQSVLSGDAPPADAESGLDQKALLFEKRYASYLVNYERSLAPGARGFTVFFQKRFNDLMQPNQFNAGGMIGLLDDQIREVASQATRISRKVNVKNLSALGDDITSRSRSEYSAAPAAAADYSIPTGRPQPASTQVDIKTYPVVGTTPDGRPVHQAPNGKRYVE